MKRRKNLKNDIRKGRQKQKDGVQSAMEEQNRDRQIKIRHLNSSYIGHNVMHAILFDIGSDLHNQIVLLANVQ